MESYYWAIQYPDGTKESQLKDNIEQKLDFKKLETVPKFIFTLIPTSQKLPSIQLLIEDSKRLIYFKRRIKMMNLATGENRLLKTLYAVGWQKTIKDTNVKNIVWIDDASGQIYNCDDLNIHNEEKK